jgi:hypothetical protein
LIEQFASTQKHCIPKSYLPIPHPSERNALRSYTIHHCRTRHRDESRLLQDVPQSTTAENSITNNSITINSTTNNHKAETAFHSVTLYGTPKMKEHNALRSNDTYPPWRKTQ